MTYTLHLNGEAITAESKREAYYLAYLITADQRWLAYDR